MKVPPKRTTLLDRIAKWGQHGVRPELLLKSPPQAGRLEEGAAAGAAAGAASMRPPNQPVAQSQVFPAPSPRARFPSLPPSNTTHLHRVQFQQHSNRANVYA